MNNTISSEQVLKDEIKLNSVTSLKGTLTEQNLLKAMEAEALAHSKYLLFASICKEEGYVKMYEQFKTIAMNELEHMKVWFKALYDKTSTIDSLRFSAQSEHNEATVIYDKFAKDAKEEGFAKLASKFMMVANVEKSHEQAFRKLIDEVESNEVFSKDEVTPWKCLNCGYETNTLDAPKVCPLCDHPQSYFESNCKQ